MPPVSEMMSAPEWRCSGCKYKSEVKKDLPTRVPRCPQCGERMLLEPGKHVDFRGSPELKNRFRKD